MKDMDALVKVFTVLHVLEFLEAEPKTGTLVQVIY